MVSPGPPGRLNHDWRRQRLRVAAAAAAGGRPAAEAPSHGPRRPLLSRRRPGKQPGKAPRRAGPPGEAAGTGSCLMPRLAVTQWHLFGITSNILVRVHLGQPAALPTATGSRGWDEELRARTAGVRLPRPGHSESSFRSHPSVCPIMLGPN